MATRRRAAVRAAGQIQARRGDVVSGFSHKTNLLNQLSRPSFFKPNAAAARCDRTRDAGLLRGFLTRLACAPY